MTWRLFRIPPSCPVCSARHSVTSSALPGAGGRLIFGSTGKGVNIGQSYSVRGYTAVPKICRACWSMRSPWWEWRYQRTFRVIPMVIEKLTESPDAINGAGNDSGESSAVTGTAPNLAFLQ